jgi:hypothetical protein
MPTALSIQGEPPLLPNLSHGPSSLFDSKRPTGLPPSPTPTPFFHRCSHHQPRNPLRKLKCSLESLDSGISKCIILVFIVIIILFSIPEWPIIFACRSTIFTASCVNCFTYYQTTRLAQLPDFNLEAWLNVRRVKRRWTLRSLRIQARPTVPQDRAHLREKMPLTRRLQVRQPSSDLAANLSFNISFS